MLLISCGMIFYVYFILFDHVHAHFKWELMYCLTVWFHIKVFLLLSSFMIVKIAHVAYISWHYRYYSLATSQNIRSSFLFGAFVINTQKDILSEISCCKHSGHHWNSSLKFIWKWHSYSRDPIHQYLLCATRRYMGVNLRIIQPSVPTCQAYI